MHAIRVQSTGGPEVLEFVEVEAPRPKEGEALVRVEAIGVNYIDVYHRSGLYNSRRRSRRDPRRRGWWRKPVRA